jgi:hypothetical protein
MDLSPTGGTMRCNSVAVDRLKSCPAWGHLCMAHEAAAVAELLLAAAGYDAMQGVCVGFCCYCCFVSTFDRHA